MLHDGGIDPGRATYIRHWMTLAFQEAQKIDHQRGGKSRLTHAEGDYTVATSRRILVGGLSLIAATVLFALVFSYLAVRFGYPEVLDQPAAQVLPALLALGEVGRAVWILYGLVPLLLIPAAVAVRDAGGKSSAGLGRAAVLLAVLSTIAMMIGLLRWPTLHWSLATQWVGASEAAQTVLAQRFAAANLYLGNLIGEFAGELFLNGFFLVSSIALAAGRHRWLVVAGVVASALGWVAMLRNLTTVVAPIAAINNVVLPVWMLVLGVVLLRRR